MNAYHYSVVRCRDAAVRGEHRNVGVLLLSPAERRVWLRRGRLDARAHLVGDDATFVRAVLDALEEEAREIVRDGGPAHVHDWLRGRARPTEDAISLTPPAMGVADDLSAEAARLAEAYLGKSAGGGRNAAEQLQHDLLRRWNLHRRFEPREFASGPARWRFASVLDLPQGPLIFSALHFSQRTPEGVVDAGWTNIGRKNEVAHFHPQTQWLTLAMGPSSGPTASAFTRALELMSEAGLNLVEPSERGVGAALMRHGLRPGPQALEAK